MVSGRYGWDVAFALSVVGMLITLANFMLCRGWIKDKGSRPDFEPLNYLKTVINAGGDCCFNCGINVVIT